MFARCGSFMRALTARRRFEDGMTEELRFHIEQYTEELIRRGMPPEEAHRRARIDFGGIEAVRTDCRDSRGLLLFENVTRQLRYSARLLRKTPGFTITALLTVAFCLGANLTIFAVVDSILWRPLPFPEPGRLVTIFNTYPKAGVDRDGSSLTNYYERRGQIPAFRSLSIYRFGSAIVGGSGSPDREPVTWVSPEFFATLGAGPVIGRTFHEAETVTGADRSVILTDQYWRQHFNGDPHVIGERIRIDDVPKTIAGVLPARFRFLSSEARLYLPLASRPEDRAPSRRHAGGNVIQTIARLKNGATVAQAQAQIDAQNGRLEKDDPRAKMVADAGFRSIVVPLHADHVAAIRPVLVLLQAGVLTLLLLGTVNLANLFLVRANSRAREHLVRRALGASRAHLFSEVVIETTQLSFLGGLLGLGLAAAGTRLAASLGAGRLPLGGHIIFGADAAIAGLIAAVGMGLALGIPIAWVQLRDGRDGLKVENRSATTGRAARATRQIFVVAQIALAVVLLTGAGLLGLSLNHALAVSPGFEPDHVLTAQISLIGNKYPGPSEGLGFATRLGDELAHQPGILAAGIATNVPFSGANGKSAATVKGYAPRPGEPVRGHYSYGVAGNYFQAMGLRLRAGRFLTEADSRRPERVCVVDEDFARYYWPGGSALGQRLFQGSETGPDAEAFTVVGVVGSTKQAGLTEGAAQGAVYYPYLYRPDSNLFVVLRATARPESLGLTLQDVVRRLDPELAVSNIRPMDDRIAESLMAQRSPAMLAAIFSGMALLLTGIGTYGVLSYTVAQRRREIGIRMALGARPGQIRGQFFRLMLRLFVAGAAIGGVGAVLAGKAMETVLFHVPGFSAAALGGSCGIVAGNALIASLLPAVRASGISPTEALADQ